MTKIITDCHVCVLYQNGSSLKARILSDSNLCFLFVFPSPQGEFFFLKLEV